MVEAVVMMVELNPKRIMHGLVQLQTQKRSTERNFRRVNNYSMPNVSEKILKNYYFLF
jgi:UDP-N-acetyl-L-fucosamine synthase